MKNLIKVSPVLALLFYVLFLTSCKKDDPENNFYNVSGAVFIVNEGNYGSVNGSISFYNPGKGTIENYIYESANSNVPTGDVLQSMGIANNKAYIIANNSNLVKAVNLNDFVQIKELSINYPRYFLQVSSSKAYITSGNMSGVLNIIDLDKNEVTGTVTLGNGPENLVKSGDYIYVANSGGFTKDSTVSVIDTKTDKEFTKIFVGENPSDLVTDADGNIWVLCKGFYNNMFLNGKSTLVKINHQSNDVEKTFEVGVAYDNFESKLLSISKDLKTLYYQDNGGVFAFDINSGSLPATAIISTEKLYGLEVNPNTSDIYCFYSGDFSSAGKVVIYDKNGVKKSELVAGIGTSGAAFK